MRVVLAMSGGVDSSAAAVLLKQQGHDVVGLFMRTGVHSGEGDTRRDNKKGCCSAVDAGDARRVADQLDIPFYALDFEREFGSIIDYFADEYLKGRTPNPCVVCNTWLKFGELWKFAQTLGADAIATGHYARIVPGEHGAELHRADDDDKDQTYVLHGIKREVLNKLLFPLGDFKKPAVRQMARDAGLGVFDKPDSVEICFVPTGKHTDVVRARRPDAVTAGNIVDRRGGVVGTHDGIDRFTIGQRKGLGVAMGTPRFVLDIVPATNDVIIGEADDLLSVGLEASRVNWMTDLPSGAFACEAKIRYRAAAVPATVTPVGDAAIVRFSEHQSAVTPGQAVAFYRGTQLIGGGWIEKKIA
jgi:tRNA-uridine 2-sulfurtransferase